jgi:energy-coupling factor transport system ATP-binding protein
MHIRTENLTHTYMPGTPFAASALKGVTLSIEQGSFTAVIGPSGSGKSTLIQHLNGLLRPTAGRVIVNGRVVGADKSELRDLRRRVGLVFQMPEQQFFAETVFDEVAFAPRSLGLGEGLVESRVKQALKQVGLDWEAVRNRSPFHLSSGQKRRAAIAAVLALQPETLILDEPTAGLDAGGRRHLFSLLARFNREQGLTVAIVTHHLEDVAALADHCLVLGAGRLVMAGPPEEIFVRGEDLKRLGLALPPVTALMHSLIQRGAPVKSTVFSLGQARLEINTWQRQVCES